MSRKDRSKNDYTRFIRAGRPDKRTQMVNPPVYKASTVLFESYQDLRNGVRHMFDDFFYGRFGTPTHFALEEAMCDLEGGAGARLFPSGMAAITTSILSVIKSGDHILIADTVYEPTRKLASHFLKQYGIKADFYDPLVGKDIGVHFQDNTKAVFVETPGSLTMEVPDLPAIAKVAHKKGAVVLVDNTWATPFRLKALNFGADIVIHAATKYISGHSDLMQGIAIARTEKLSHALKRTALTLGQTVSADDAASALRGLRTLPTRLDRHEKSALKVAKYLETHAQVERVLHPALPSCPGHAIFKRNFSGGTGLFSFTLKGGDESHLPALVDDLELFGIGFSWGGFESLILPADPKPLRTINPWKANGPLIRLSIGLEDPDDLIKDLKDGLERYEKAAGLS